MRVRNGERYGKPRKPKPDNTAISDELFILGVFLLLILMALVGLLPTPKAAPPNPPREVEVSYSCETCNTVECMTCLERWPSFDTGELNYCKSLGYQYTWGGKQWAQPSYTAST